MTAAWANLRLFVEGFFTRQTLPADYESVRAQATISAHMRLLDFARERRERFIAYEKAWRPAIRNKIALFGR